MDYINSKLLIVAKNENITTRHKNQGIWVTTLLPLCIILSAFKYHLESTQNYKILSSISISLLLSSIIFIINSCRGKSTIVLKILASILTTTYLLAIANVNIFIIAGMSIVILCYEHLFLFILRECPKTFTFGEASVTLQGMILFLSSTFLNVFFPNNMPKSDIQIASVIIQIGLITIAALSLISYKIKQFRRPIPFYMLLSVLTLIFLVIILYGLIQQNAFVWIFDLFTASNRRVYLIFYWLISVILATLAIQWQIGRARKATTISRKTFHVLAVLVFIPGLLYECTIIYLASGVVFGILLFIELLRILNIPPLGDSLQEIFIVYSDDKDKGTFSLTQLYLLVGCSVPLWIHPTLCDITDSAGVYLLPVLSGLLSIGVGDTAASAVGIKWGRHRWRGGLSKTVEGTVGCVICQMGVFGALYYFNFLVVVTRMQMYQVIGAIIVTSLVEAKTTQVDNLVLPLIMYIILIL